MVERALCMREVAGSIPHPPSTFLRRRPVKIESRSKMAVGKNHIKYVKSPNCLLPGPVLPCNCCFLETRIIFFFRQYSHIVDNKPAITLI